MIISFAIENWMSFREKVTFSMLATRGRQHNARVSKLRKYQTRILPIAAIYGGNAAGKSNFFKAFQFVQTLVVRGSAIDSSIGVEPFQLNGQESEKPTRFILELLIDENIYEFSFSVTRTVVVDEKLISIKTASEKVLYERSAGAINIDPSSSDHEFLEFVFRGTRDNQLFLTNSVSQKLDDFRPIYNWFKNTLQLIGPDSILSSIELYFDENYPHYNTLQGTLQQLDLGISRLAGEKVPFDNIPLPAEIKDRIKEDIKENKGIRCGIRSSGDRYVIYRKQNQLIAKKLITYHPKADGDEVKFEINQESDGSQRVLDLLPAFVEQSTESSKNVIVIDEIDRSLHTLLTRRLIEMYLSACSADTRTQLLLTTHDVMLMDQKLLRRDEMWVTERDSSGASTLFSFSEFKDVRYDKDVRKSYLQGRLGGIPRFFLEQVLPS